MVRCLIKTLRRPKGKTKYVWKNYTHTGRNLTRKGLTKTKALSQIQKIHDYYSGKLLDCRKVTKLPKKKIKKTLR